MASSELDEKIGEVKFNFRVMHDAFSASLLDDDDIEMDNYLLAYKELYNFFMSMGKIFGFVGSDVKNKIEILEEFRKNDSADNFKSLKTMINHEKNNNLLKKSDYTSGSRTLLRLHRGLDFFRVFMGKLGDLRDEDKTHSVCQDAYNSTLAKFHPWIVRKGAVVAMYALPTRGVLMQKVCRPDEVQQAIDILPKMLQSAGEVYDRTEKCYTEHDLHDLP